MSRTGTHTVLLGGVTTVRCSSATTTAGTCSIGPTGSCPTAQHPRNIASLLGSPKYHRGACCWTVSYTVAVLPRPLQPALARSGRPVPAQRHNTRETSRASSARRSTTVGHAVGLSLIQSLFFRVHYSRHWLDRADRFLPNGTTPAKHREPPRLAEVPPWGMLLEAR